MTDDEMAYPVLTEEGARNVVERLVAEDATPAEKVEAVLKISVGPDELPELATVLGLAWVADPPAFVALDAIVGLTAAEWDHLQRRWNAIAEGKYVYVDATESV